MTSPALSPLIASVLVSCGGAIGALGRYLLGRAMTHWLGQSAAAAFPWATLAVNLLGCFAMGMLFGWLTRHGGASEAVRLLLGVGVLGGFTTFSAFSLEMMLLIERGAIGLAAAYAIGSVLIGLGALYFGLMLMRAAA